MRRKERSRAVVLAWGITISLALLASAGGPFAADPAQPLAPTIRDLPPLTDYTCLYCVFPEPPVLRKWNSQNRDSDRNPDRDNPLNPESALDYMLRTF
ncbi:MAG: hypothetical protein FJ118_00640 [Deltaproteobacteria bacterium]|nr:hypothetical protein [Deltaproteobacteria bacterium]